MSSKKRSAVTLVLMRHGQSRWNAKNRFTGWTDVRLTEQGERESWAAGRLLQAHGLRVGSAFTSLLTRAQTTARLALGTRSALAARRNAREPSVSGSIGMSGPSRARGHERKKYARWPITCDATSPRLLSSSPSTICDTRKVNPASHTARAKWARRAVAS